ncbi:MAG: gliding motility-associated C-terminal domain-containing protein [Saprospiraceae bacterium]
MATNNDPDFPVTCTWYPDTLILSGQGTNMVMVNTQNLGTYTIYVIKMNDLGCVDTLFTEYTCKPIMEVADTSLISYSQCDSFTIDFSYGDTVNFCWLFGDPNHPDSLSADPAPSYTYPDTGTYIVGLIPKEICKDTIWYPIHVGPSPKIDFTCDFDTCRDTVIVQFTDLSMVPDSITSWNWTFSTGDTSTLQNPSVIITEKDTLIATLVITWGDGCSDSLTMEKVVDPFICYPNGVVIACMGDSTELNPGINPDTDYHYSWSPGIFLSDSTIFNPVVVLDTSLTFTVTITRDSCEKTMDVMVIVPPMFNLEVIGDSIVCDSSEVMLIAIADVPVTYKWSEDPDFDDVFSTNDTVFVQPGRPSIYYVMATDTFGCSKMDTFTVGNYMVGLDISNDTMICLGDEIMLSATSVFGTDILTYNWEPDSAIVSGDSTGFIIVAPTEDTWYTVKATNQFGCMKTDSVLVMVKDISDLFTISADPDTLIAGVIDSSQLMVTNLPGYTYQWMDPNFILGPSDIPDPIAAPGGISRVYSVKITDTVGCMAVLEIPVIVIPLACKDFVFVPNVFTPNADDLNDILYARAPESTDYYFAIYNRWGELVFETNDPNIGWDGVFNGQAVNADVYGYFVRYNCEGEVFFKKGNVSVLR